MPSRVAHPQPVPAFQVERYAIFDEFAAGGMATVHFARLLGAHGFRRTVAVKRLLPHLMRNHEFALMLIDEARLAARVCHPNVVTTLDVVQTDSELLLVMEYVHGESLAKLSRWASERGERIPVPIACAILADALHGLHAAHEAKDERGAELGLVHRDVSPQNVLIGLDGIPRIADFGVAKAAGRAQTTGEGMLKGKLAYMAPEQLTGGEASRASDVFAAAVVLWEALTGERLFSGKNHAETTFKVLSAPIPTLRSRDASIPASLDAVLMRGLARDPGQRFASARELGLAVEACVPSVRPSDLSRWVEHVVGDRLAPRLSLLRAIEQSGEVDTQAQTRPRLSLPRSADMPSPRRDQVEPLATPGAHVAASGSAALRKPGARRYLGWAALLVMLLLAAVAAWRGYEPPSATRAFSPASPEPSAVRAGKQATRSANVAAPSVESVVVPPRTREQAASAGGGKAPEKSRARSVREARPRDKGPGCDPPFTIDSASHVLFKAACM